ncbi:MAG: hypothetical protein J6T40_05455, partial [Clostridiales bacterium]|nr:hypothetical protein [Clostridiales bacterium]
LGIGGIAPNQQWKSRWIPGHSLRLPCIGESGFLSPMINDALLATIITAVFKSLGYIGRRQKE